MMCPVFFQTNTFRRTFSKPESKNLGKSVKKKDPDARKNRGRNDMRSKIYRIKRYTSPKWGKEI